MPRLRAALCGLLMAAALREFPELHAQTPQDRAVAQSLFDQARQKMRDGRNEEACPMLEQSQKLDPAVGTLLHLGECYERLGKNASAWAMFREAAAAALAAGQPQRERLAEQRARQLEGHLSRLWVRVPVEARKPGLKVFVAGVELSPERWAEPFPVDPGAHRVEGKAWGVVFFQHTVQIAEPGVTEVVIPPHEVTPAAPASSSAPPSPPPVPPASSSSWSSSSPSSPPSWSSPSWSSSSWSSWQRGALVAGGLGALSLGVGAFFGFRALGLKDDARPHCDAQNYCDDEGVQARKDAISSGNLSTLFVGLGAAGVGVGVALWLAAPGKPAAATLRVTPAGALVEGRF